MTILKMIQDGKITPQEGVELLKALAQPATGPSRDVAGGPKEGPPGDEGETRDAHRPRSILEDVIEGFSFVNFPFGFFGDTHKFEEEHEGRFEPEPGRPITIRLRTANGRLVLKGWERPDYHLRIIKSLRGPGEEEARRRAQDMAQFTATPAGLVLESRFSGGWNNAGVAAELSLPADLLYRLALHSSNGRIEVDGLKVEDLEAQTSNGRIVCERTTGGRVRLRTSNGRILANCSARELDVDTSNGSVTVVPFGDQQGDSWYRLRTSNGGIRVRPYDQPDCGYDIDAATSMGHVELELPDLEYSVRERTMGHRRSRARTAGFDGKTRRVRIEARTSNGSIVVSRSV